MIFIETQVFTRQALELLDDDACAELQQLHRRMSDAGDSIAGTGRVRVIS